ncbi:MAG: hypothetical protein J5958_00835 [Clostridia bacterium]|nr:hypothetical protein [Clostridia bacterium]
MSRLPKKKKVPLSRKDRVLYTLTEFLLYWAGLVCVPILLLEDRIVLASPDNLAWSEGFSLLLFIPSFLIASVGLIVALDSETNGRTFRQFWSYLFETRLRKALTILFIVLYLFFLPIPVLASSTVLKADGSVESRSFGILYGKHAKEDVEEATFEVFYNSSSYPPTGGRFSSRAVGVVCYVTLKTESGKKITFQYYKPENLPAIAALYPDRCRFVQDVDVDRWLKELDCDDDAKEQIRELFQSGAE